MHQVDCWRVRLVGLVKDPHTVRHGWRSRSNEVVHHLSVRGDDDRVLVAPFRLFDELMFITWLISVLAAKSIRRFRVSGGNVAG